MRRHPVTIGQMPVSLRLRTMLNIKGRNTWAETWNVKKRLIQGQNVSCLGHKKVVLLTSQLQAMQPQRRCFRR
jgi:hypothetical protein